MHSSIQKEGHMVVSMASSINKHSLIGFVVFRSSFAHASVVRLWARFSQNSGAESWRRRLEKTRTSSTASSSTSTSRGRKKTSRWSSRNLTSRSAPTGLPKTTPATTVTTSSKSVGTIWSSTEVGRRRTMTRLSELAVATGSAFSRKRNGLGKTTRILWTMKCIWSSNIYIFHCRNIFFKYVVSRPTGNVRNTFKMIEMVLLWLTSERASKREIICWMGRYILPTYLPIYLLSWTTKYSKKTLQVWSQHYQCKDSNCAITYTIGKLNLLFTLEYYL